MSELEELEAQNEAKVSFLRQYRIPVPTDLMYVTSLLEWLLLEDLPQAKLYHEQRIAPMLDTSCANLQQLIAQAEENGKTQAEAQAAAERTATLLAPLRG